MTQKKPKPVGFREASQPRGRSHITNLDQVWDDPNLAQETANLGKRLRKASESGKGKTLQQFFPSFYRQKSPEPQSDNIILLPTPDTEN